MFDAERDRPVLFRLLHSSGDSLIADRAEALDRLVTLPGARLFVVQADQQTAATSTLPGTGQR